MGISRVQPKGLGSNGRLFSEDLITITESIQLMPDYVCRSVPSPLAATASSRSEWLVAKFISRRTVDHVSSKFSPAPSSKPPWRIGYQVAAFDSLRCWVAEAGISIPKFRQEFNRRDKCQNLCWLQILDQTQKLTLPKTVKNQVLGRDKRSTLPPWQPPQRCCTGKGWRPDRRTMDDA